MTYVLIFGAIGAIVLLLACINYINLSTAYATNRFKEVGVRKVLGAFRKQLVVHYIMESWVLAMGAMVVALGWIELARPFFEQLTGKAVENLYQPGSLLLLFGIASMAGVLSGIYPSLVLASLRPATVLKGRFRTGTSGVLLRKGLVVLQYSVTIVLISGILVVKTQLNFINKRDLGFNDDNLLMMGVNGSREVIRGYDAFANEVLSHPQFTGIARANTSLGGGLGNSTAELENAEGRRVNGTMYRFRVDHDFVNVYQMKLLAGRNFLPGSSHDSTRGFIVNETAVRQFGYQDPKQAIGKYISMGGMEGEIIGVVKDFHYNSLQYAIEPAAFTLLRFGFSRISVRVGGNVQEGIEKITSIWKAHFPESIIDFGTAEDGIGRRYQSERRFSSIFMIFSLVSMAIACLGLFALVSHDVEGRTKEIGIRKALGATVANIVNMVSREFLMLIVISCLVAIPMAVWIMGRWLDSFVYRTDLGAQVFLVSGLATLLIAFATISFKVVRSALSNPVDALRSE